MEQAPDARQTKKSEKAEEVMEPNMVRILTALVRDGVTTPEAIAKVMGIHEDHAKYLMDEASKAPHEPSHLLTEALRDERPTSRYKVACRGMDYGYPRN